MSTEVPSPSPAILGVPCEPPHQFWGCQEAVSGSFAGVKGESPPVKLIFLYKKRACCWWRAISVFHWGGKDFNNSGWWLLPCSTEIQRLILLPFNNPVRLHQGGSQSWSLLAPVCLPSTPSQGTSLSLPLFPAPFFSLASHFSQGVMRLGRTLWTRPSLQWDGWAGQWGSKRPVPLVSQRSEILPGRFTIVDNMWFSDLSNIIKNIAPALPRSFNIPDLQRARELLFPLAPWETQARGSQPLFKKLRGELRQLATSDSPANPSQ